MSPKGRPHSETGSGRSGCRAAGARALPVGQGTPNAAPGQRGGGGRAGHRPKLAPHPVLAGAWLGRPSPAPGLSCCSNSSARGQHRAGGGGGAHLAPGSWENATAARPAAPPANKAPAAGNQSGPLWCQAASWGTGTAPWGPAPPQDTQYPLPGHLRAAPPRAPRTETPFGGSDPIRGVIAPPLQGGVNLAPRKPGRRGALPSGSGEVTPATFGEAE